MAAVVSASSPRLAAVRIALRKSQESYALLNARVGIEIGRTALTLSLRNLTNARPNLGDIGYIGYEQFEPSGLPRPQAVTLPPTTARLELRQSF